MWPNPQFPADLVTSTKEILNGKLHFLCRTTGLEYATELVFSFWVHIQDYAGQIKSLVIHVVLDICKFPG